MLRSIKSAVAAIALVAALAGYGMPASASNACRSAIVGTYLLTILRSNDGSLSSRAVMSFHDDGSFTSIDSSQALGVQGAGFSAMIGAYECTGRHSANALGLNFGFTDPPGIGRTDWAITIDRWTRTIEGTVNLYIIDDLTDDPLAEDVSLFDTFMFTFGSVRVPAQVP